MQSTLREKTAKATADLLVELATRSRFARLLEVVDRHKKDLAVAEENTAKAARAVIAGQGLLDDRTRRAKEEVTKAWTQGQRIGFRHAEQELAILGATPAQNAPNAHANFLLQLLDDVERSATDPNISEAELHRRIEATASVAANRGYSEAQRISYRQSGIRKKVWVTNFTANTCPTCAALHGTVIDVESEFGADRSFSAAKPPGVYQDLAVPPRHPHCRCRIAAYTDELAGDPGPSPQTMQAFARDFAEKAKGMAPRSWATGELSEVAKSTDFMTAEDIRNMPHSKWEQAKAFYRACILKLRG